MLCDPGSSAASSLARNLSVLSSHGAASSSELRMWMTGGKAASKGQPSSSSVKNAPLKKSGGHTSAAVAHAAEGLDIFAAEKIVNVLDGRPPLVSKDERITAGNQDHVAP